MPMTSGPSAQGVVAGATGTGGFLGNLSTIGSTLGNLGGFMSGIGSLGGMFGGKGPSLSRMIKINENEMRFQRDIQRDLRLSAYPDTVASLKSAGLNPMLAYTNGVAQGGSASYPNIQSNFQSNASGDLARMQKLSTAAQIANLAANTKKTEADTQNVQAQTTSEGLKQILTGLISSGQSLSNTMSDINVKREQWQDETGQYTGRVKAETWSALYKSALLENDRNTMEFLNDFAHKRDFNNFGEMLERLKYRGTQLDNMSKEIQQEASKQGIHLQALQFPEAQATADFYKSTGVLGQSSNAAKSGLQIMQLLKQVFGK